MSLMITVTDSAREELKRVVQTQNLASGKCLGLATPPVWEGVGDFGVVIDEHKEGDYEVDFQEETVLLVDSGLLEHLTGAVMDFKASPEGPRFTLDVY